MPERQTLTTLREAARTCRGCALYAPATQTVFGEGPERARVVLVGEQPGDSEDRAGRPFIGPAGEVLDRALLSAGLNRAEIYVTNAVKHFNFESRGKARLHKKPKPGDVRACRPWLDAELASLRPVVLVLLGATAAQAVLGPKFRVTQERGVPRATPLAPVTFATWHPSNVLRAPDSESRQRLFDELALDLKLAATSAKTARAG
jgi:DNA polymerase